jgi:LPS sulfotransferase NodH
VKILILSHTRCGSTTLCKWIEKELNIELDETPYNKMTFNSVFNKEDVIRKIVLEEYYPSDNDINKFDKVICLNRENIIDAAISFINADNKNSWHDTYEITNEWINNNKNIIIETAHKYEHLKDHLKNKNLFKITYENLYINKTDVNKVINYLNIVNPKHLDMIDYDKKYRKDTYTLTYDFKRKNII